VPQPAPTPAPGVTIIAPGAEPAPLILRGGGSRGGVIHNPDPAQSADSPAGTTTAPGAAPTSSMIGNAPAGSTAADIDSSNIHWRAIAQNWKAETGEVRRRWSLLTPADVEAVGGIRANLVRTLQQRYGISAAQADLEVETFERR
jgi:hypothetical protein